MIQEAMRNDPRMASDPMMQQAMQAIATNPALASQVSEMMRDPSVLQHMQSMMQQQASSSGGTTNLMPPTFPPVGRMPQQQATAPGPPQPSSSQQQGAPVSSDEDLTEEEMIAEAIRRSLQDS